MKRFLLPILTGVAAVAAHAQESDSVRMYRLQQIEVTATRATPRTPVAYTDLSHDAIARNSYGTDIPTVLALTPSMIATNGCPHFLQNSDCLFCSFRGIHYTCIKLFDEL